MSMLNHPTVLPCYGAKLKGEHPFVVLPLIQGSLRETIVQRKQSLEDWLPRMEVVARIADCLTYLHSKSIIHRMWGERFASIAYCGLIDSNTHMVVVQRSGNLSSETIFLQLEGPEIYVGGFSRCVVYSEEVQWLPDESAYIGMPIAAALQPQHIVYVS
jgi:serine/threonine protein kinase